MHANESRKRQLYLISINGRTVQEGHPHTGRGRERAGGDGNWEKLEEMMEGTGWSKEEWERDRMDSGVKQLALSFNVCSALPARRGQSTPENKKKGKVIFLRGLARDNISWSVFFFLRERIRKTVKAIRVQSRVRFFFFFFFAFHSATDVYNSTGEGAFSQVKNGSGGGTSCCTQFITRLNVQCWK